jgi:hypothetical protein
MGTKREELESTTGCLAKAADDEPIFILRAHDMLAPEIVRAWVAAVSRRHMVGHGWEQPRPHLLNKLSEAEDLARRMEAWQQKHGCKVPD